MMGTPFEPRKDPLALTWEPAVLAASIWLIGATVALPLARMVAAWLTGHGWVPPTDPLDGIWGVLTGRVQLGFPKETTPPTLLVVVFAVVFEVAVVVALVVVWLHFAASIGVGVRRGLANQAQARAVLGVGRLRQARREIRPDLYAKQSSRRWR